MHFFLLFLNAGLGRSYWNEKQAIDKKLQDKRTNTMFSNTYT